MERAMADQVSPLGSLATEPLAIAAKSQAQVEKTRPPKAADTRPLEKDGGAVKDSAQSLEAATKTIQDYLQHSRSDLQFTVDKASKRMVFKIVNAATQEVIRQVPSEEVLTMAKKLAELATPQDQTGVLLDGHA